MSGVGFFSKDTLELAIQQKLKTVSAEDFADIVSYIFNCQVQPTKRNKVEFGVLFIDNCDELQPYREDK